jgi:hypothetical protein
MEIDPDTGAAFTGAKAVKSMEKEYLENGGKSWKAWTGNKLCIDEMSGSVPWKATRAYSKNQI